ncbi:hypothetical protein OP10G_2086 [Fimbriimonas ginsengisoli Gsoil 348]|uniref:DUF1015 domain-containing protein n=1 Tax=Fimbriimonas ginsengisoli Gsoil 348 TaxID=661478 RepID=A0A068NV41_FIMGI|nr:hypothetical protein OP10G_2086 [Fimbriimonas ginsengisoli Gsoil 348]
MRSPYNVVHVTLPESKPDDRSKYVKYARSAALLSEWRRDGILMREDVPVIYRYTQTFSLPHLGETYTRTSILVLLKTEPYERGVVLPHERTFPKHKEDRLRILEATRAHLESIFGLFEDPDARIHETIRNAPAGTSVEVTTEDGVHQVFEPISDPESIDTIVAMLGDRKLWIADGHHRYETAVAFREALGERDGEVPEDYLPIALCSMSDPGLVLLPTHRIVAKLPFGHDETLARLSTAFDIRETHSSRLFDALGHGQVEGRRTFGLAMEGGLGYVLTPKDEATLMEGVSSEESDRLRGLDVTVLHSLIFERLLGLTGLDQISYTRDPMEAIRAADQGAAASFLMNAPTVDDMRAIALGGERMPQKSTYYFPKVLSGLVMWSLNDF